MQNYLSTTQHTVSWFSKRHQAGELELKSPFQRNPVWSARQKGYLIDTILRGYPVPELYMQEYTDAAGHDRYVVVDGQQRLRACLEFLAGRVALDPDDSPDFADMEFDDLNGDQKKSIFGYNFVVRVLPEMPDTELRAMFQRLNRNVVALNAQELRHATYWGEFISCVETLASDERWSGLGIFTSNDIRRMVDIEYVSELAIAVIHGPQNKKDSLDDWYKAYEKSFPKREHVETVMKATLGELLAILPEMNRTRWKKKSDFYTLFTYLAKHERLLPFSRDGRKSLNKVLSWFATAVDLYIADPDAKDVNDKAKAYAQSVERAASDLANRKKREACLHDVLRSAIESEEKAAK